MPALPEKELLFVLLRGFIRARWLFVACLLVAVGFGVLLGYPFPVFETLAVGAVVVAYNVVFWLHHRARRDKPLGEVRISRNEAALQIGLDLTALTALVHLQGGAGSPFVLLYLIHAIAGGMLLTNRGAWRVAASAFALFLGVVMLEHHGVLPRHPFGGWAPSPEQRWRFEAAISFAFLVTLITSVTISTWAVNGLRLRERQLVLIQGELLKQSQDLEKACASLTAKQAELVQAEKQASLGRLVAGIAHEINNPVQFLDGNMGVLREAFQDVLPLLDAHAEAHPGFRVARLDYPFFRKQVPVLLGDMADGAARIGAIVRDLRTFARRDEGRLDERVDLNEAVRSSIRLLHNQLKHFRVYEELDPALPRIRGNHVQLQQVVVNALQNACQAMKDAGRGTIRVKAKAELGGEWIRLTVGDSGCGIPPEIRDRIFDPFFTTKSRSEGTGLGLSITYGIIQQHHGRIEVESQVGRGTSFHFLLPRDGGSAA